MIAKGFVPKRYKTLRDHGKRIPGARLAGPAAPVALMWSQHLPGKRSAGRETPQPRGYFGTLTDRALRHPLAVSVPGLCELGGGQLGAGELGLALTSMRTVTVRSPGLTVSVQLTHTPASAAPARRPERSGRPPRR